jgi:hypothetical protein
MDGADAPYSYNTTKLPRGLSHLLKRSDIDAQLAERPPRLLVNVSRTWSRADLWDPDAFFSGRRWRGGRPSVRAGDWLPLCQISWWSTAMPEIALDVGLWLHVYAVPAERRAELRELTTNVALPHALDWAERLLAGPETRLDLRPTLLWYLDGDELASVDA